MLTDTQIAAARAGLLVLPVEPPIGENVKAIHVGPLEYDTTKVGFVSEFAVWESPHQPGDRIPLDGGEFVVESVEAKRFGDYVFQSSGEARIVHDCTPEELWTEPTWLWLYRGRWEPKPEGGPPL